MEPRYQRDGTVGTVTVAALANLDVGIVARGGQYPLPSSLYGASLAVGIQIIQQLSVVELAVPPVNLRNLRFKVCKLTFRQTAHYIKLLNTSFSLGLGKLQNSIDTFLLGIVNETASVDHNNLTLGVIAIMRTVIAVGLHQSHQHLAVNEILGATERYEIYCFQLISKRTDMQQMRHKPAK